MSRDLAIATVIALLLHAAAIVALDARRSTPTAAIEATPLTLDVVFAMSSAVSPRKPEPIDEPTRDLRRVRPEVLETDMLEPIDIARLVDPAPASQIESMPAEIEPIRAEPLVAATVPNDATPSERLEPAAALALSRRWPLVPLSALAVPTETAAARPSPPLARRAVELEPVPRPGQESRQTKPAANDADPDRVEPDEAGGTRQPVVSRNPRPAYPRVARRRGYEGEVLLRVEVLETGSVGAVDVERSSGHRVLDRAAIRAVRRWRFEPATRLGEPVSTWIEVPVEFSIEAPGD